MLTTEEVADIVGVDEAVVFGIAEKLGIKHRISYMNNVKVAW